MGADKTRLEIGGIGVAARAARALAIVARPSLAVGEEAGTGLEAVPDPRRGPLVAFATGLGALAGRGCRGPVLLVACDLPFVTAALLAHLAHTLGDADAAVPVLDGRDQPLAACYAPRAAAVACDLVSEGKTAMRDLIAAIETHRLPEEEWAHVASPDVLLDVDTPEDFEAARRILEGPA